MNCPAPLPGHTGTHSLDGQLIDVSTRPVCGTNVNSEEELTRHLIDIHNYKDDPYDEDTAQTNAWTMWRTP